MREDSARRRRRRDAKGLAVVTKPVDIMRLLTLIERHAAQGPVDRLA
jgi:hypothetical protein